MLRWCGQDDDETSIFAFLKWDHWLAMAQGDVFFNFVRLLFFLSILRFTVEVVVRRLAKRALSPMR